MSDVALVLGSNKTPDEKPRPAELGVNSRCGIRDSAPLCPLCIFEAGDILTLHLLNFGAFEE